METGVISLFSSKVSATASSKLTHQTSPRFIDSVPHGGFCPIQSLGRARLILCHLLVSDIQVLADDVGPNEGLDEFADAPPPDDGVQPVVDALVHGDGQLLVHGALRK